MNHVRFHFSIGGLLVVVALLGLACAALVAATPLVASAAHTLNLALMSLAVVGAICRRGPARVYWLAAAVVGWVYYFSAIAWPVPPEPPLTPQYPNYYATQPAPESRPRLLTSKLLDWLESKRTARLSIGTHVVAQWAGGGYWPGRITDANETGYLVAWDDGSSPTWDTPAQIASSITPLYQVGHAVFGVLLALLAGWVMSRVFQEPSAQQGRGELPMSLHGHVSSPDA
jgi:hypothetical protein